MNKSNDKSRPSPGTLYWLWIEKKQRWTIAMFLKVEYHGSCFYYHYFLDDKGEIIGFVANTEILENDSLWWPKCGRINL